MLGPISPYQEWVWEPGNETARACLEGLDRLVFAQDS
jgi:hypothetical protein